LNARIAHGSISEHLFINLNSWLVRRRNRGMPIIDIHPHIVSPDIKRYPLAPLGGTQSTWSSERPTTYDMLLQEMDAAGVDKAAIVHSSTAYGYDNS
jgi:predicted TIM-barrel fold metal-dependent hydrolase